MTYNFETLTGRIIFMMDDTGPFLAVGCINAATSEPDLTYINLDGSPHTITGPVVECSHSIMCDANGPFHRARCECVAADLDMSGNPYTSVGTVSVCGCDMAPPPTADLSMTKIDATDPVNQGDNITYTITVTNNGPSVAENVVVTDVLPAGLTLISTTGCQGDPNGLPNCVIGNIAPGASATVMVVAATDGTTPPRVTNTATVTSDTADPDLNNNTATQETTVTQPSADLAITKADAVDPVMSGDNITYTITVTNNGPDTAVNVVMSDILPPGLTLVSTSGCNNDPSGSPDCQLGDIPSGTSKTVTIVASTDASTPASISNTATVTSDTGDPDPNNNSATESTTVGSDLSVALCCGDDLLADNPTIANQRLAWLNPIQPNMLDAGGSPVTVDGDDVHKVLDPINPSAPAFQTPLQTGVDFNTGAPSLISSCSNGNPCLQFQQSELDRMRIDTGAPDGGSFTFYYLLAADDPAPADNNATILAVGDTSVGDGSDWKFNGSTWQISKDSNEPCLVFRIRNGSGDTSAGVDPTMIVSQPPCSNERLPSNGGPVVEKAIATEAEFFDQQFHLFTVSYDDTTNILSIYFDGELRLQMDFTPMANTKPVSSYFRLFSNREGVSGLTGRLAEFYFADRIQTDQEVATVNSYLICKHALDTDQVTIEGSYTLQPPGTFTGASPWVEVTDGITGQITYENIDTGLVVNTLPWPGMSLCA